MQPQQPEVSSAQPAQDGSATPAEGSPETQEASRPNWFQRLFGPRGTDESTATDQPESPETSSTLQLTREELDRRVQAEADRRENKRLEEAAKAEKAAARRQLRDTDPFAYAEEDRKAEQVQSQDSQLTGFLTSIGSEYDRHALDPIVQALPEAERSRILGIEGAGRGLEGRKLIVSESLKALEKHWKAEAAKDAEDKLRHNQAFRKQLLAEIRRSGREPDFVTGGAPSVADQSVSNILREQLRSRH